MTTANDKTIKNDSDSQSSEETPLLLLPPKTFPSSLSLTSSCEDLQQELQAQLMMASSSNGSSKMNASRNDRYYYCKGVSILLVTCGLLVGLATLPLLISSISKSKRHPGTTNTTNGVPVFSVLDPVQDLNLYKFERWSSSDQSKNDLLGDSQTHPKAWPTNAWYQNLIVRNNRMEEPTHLQRVYANPYLVDVVGSLIPGLRAQMPRILSGGTDTVQATTHEYFGVTLGVASNQASAVAPKTIGQDSGIGVSDPVSLTHSYTIKETTPLGITLQWNAYNMTSSIVRGMPFATMEYHKDAANPDLIPTIAAPLSVSDLPLVDGDKEMPCLPIHEPQDAPLLVQSHITWTLQESDFTWMIVVSRPVHVQCVHNHVVDGNAHHPTYLQVVDGMENDDEPLIVRLAMINPCTNGMNPVRCPHRPTLAQVKQYQNILLQHASVVPGSKSDIQYSVQDDRGVVTLDWNAQDWSVGSNTTKTENQLVMFTMPHHRKLLQEDDDATDICVPSLFGSSCLQVGNKWTLVHENMPSLSFGAPRPMRPQFLTNVSTALQHDLQYTLPSFFQKGAGDTYFSGKMLAKLARIVLIGQELHDLCDDAKTEGVRGNKVSQACTEASTTAMPSRRALEKAVDNLKKWLSVWLGDGTAETPFVYDAAWGGLVSCGCAFNGDGCDNRVPECPAFADPNLNFGNAFYNDHHFHYGYFIYAAAAVANFDSAWGQEYFERVLLMIRDIGNPNPIDDPSFPLVRHKDWYQGSSWASGVAEPPYLNGKNQESSSEAIAAYEAIGMYGQTMASIFEDAGDELNRETAKEIGKLGRLLATTEITTAQTYWHVTLKDLADYDDSQYATPSTPMYPKSYQHNAVGILWSTMVQFGTWFGTAAYLPYGIQLLPITPLSESRDDLLWVAEMYLPFTTACHADFTCTLQGWSFLQVAVLAMVGHDEAAAHRLSKIPAAAYESAGGNGHSATNLWWYLATRQNLDAPIVPLYVLDAPPSSATTNGRPAPSFELAHSCYRSDTCTEDTLTTDADGYSCRERIEWMIHSKHVTEWEACAVIGGIEYPSACGGCNPKQEAAPKRPLDHEDGSEEENNALCPPCTAEECNSSLNRCPAYPQTFVCTRGASHGGCAGSPWPHDDQCKACCEMTKCSKMKDVEAKKVELPSKNNCPPCPPSICYGQLNLCPVTDAPFLCTKGFSLGGCSSTPWALNEGMGQCQECCEIRVSC